MNGFILKLENTSARVDHKSTETSNSDKSVQHIGAPVVSIGISVILLNVSSENNKLYVM